MSRYILYLLIEHYAKKEQEGGGGWNIAPCVLELYSTWKRAVTFTARLLYLQGTSPASNTL
jgi:hypothetical protein